MVNVIEFLSDDSNLDDIFGNIPIPITRKSTLPTSQSINVNDHSIIEIGSDPMSTDKNTTSNNNNNNNNNNNSSIIILDDSITEIKPQKQIFHSSPNRTVITSDITDDIIQIIQPDDPKDPFKSILPIREKHQEGPNQIDIINNLTSLLSKHTPKPIIRTTNKPLTKEKIKYKYTQEELDCIYETSKLTNLKLLKDVNKKKSKEDIQNEMKVCISSKCDEYFKSINENYKELIDFKIDEFESTLPMIKFKRNVRSIFNNSKLSFVPVDPFWIEEEIIILVFEMEEIVKLLPNHGLRNIIHSLKKERDKRRIIIFAQNHDKFLNKLKNNVNKKYNELTKMHLNSQSVECRNNNDIDEFEFSQPQPKKRKSNSKQANNEFLNVKPEHVLLQIKKYESRGITFQRVVGLLQIFDWVKSYSYSIGKRNYDEFELNKDVAHLSKEKSGDNPRDTYHKMLTSIPRLTNRKSDKILQDPNLNSMVKMYEHFQNGNEFQKELKSVLQSDVINSLMKFFTSENENELI